eukprot:TRINITY_DN249_c0_g3_i1.p1 TRINITY_DN249_c0_g3~~TRINITY_DN249_c0_g3_i1.p1  ORF type:complete len:275 (+),score=53.33 TRINITY_DN249_c0_g3_i1:102-827(+)
MGSSVDKTDPTEAERGAECGGCSPRAGVQLAELPDEVLTVVFSFQALPLALFQGAHLVCWRWYQCMEPHVRGYLRHLRDTRQLLRSLHPGRSQVLGPVYAPQWPRASAPLTALEYIPTPHRYLGGVSVLRCGCCGHADVYATNTQTNWEHCRKCGADGLMEPVADSCAVHTINGYSLDDPASPCAAEAARPAEPAPAAAPERPPSPPGASAGGAAAAPPGAQVARPPAERNKEARCTCVIA